MATIGYAQINKGAVVIGGSLNLNFANTDSNITDIIVSGRQKSINSSIHPATGVFLSENWQVGGGFEYSHSSNTYYYSYYSGGDLIESWQKQKSDLYLINVFVTRYIQIKNGLYFNISCDINAGTGKVNYYAENFEDRTYDRFVVGINIYPGLTYFLSNRWGITASMGELYAKRQTTNNEDLDQDAKIVTAGFSLKANTFSIGVQYYLNNGSQE
jgi:hypothetical protein